MARKPDPARPLKLLHLHSSFSLGGKEARAVQLMNAFGCAAEHVIVSAMPEAMNARAAINKGIKADFPEDFPALAGRPGVRRYQALARAMKGFDLVLTYNWGSMDAVMAHTIFAQALSLPPLIHHEDGFNADEVVRLKRRRNWFRMAALAKARALVVPSRQLETIALERWKQPAGKIHRIPNGIDVERYEKRPQRGALPGFVRREGEIVVGTLAGLRAVKNLPLLVRAVAAAGTNLRLVIVGEGPERDAILAAAAQAGIADRLLMPGFLSDPAQYVGLFDIFALSSDSEQLPIALVEAMAAGLPVVATDVGDVALTLSGTNRALVSRAGEVGGLAANIAKLASDPDLRRNLGDANRARAAAEHNGERMIERYRLLYASAAKRPDFARQ